MEIIKQTESFLLKDATSAYEINGHITRETTGVMNIHFSINNLDGKHIGDCHYNTSVDNDIINFGVNCSEDVRDAVTACADTVIDSVLEHFKSDI